MGRIKLSCFCKKQEQQQEITNRIETTYTQVKISADCKSATSLISLIYKECKQLNSPETHDTIKHRQNATFLYFSKDTISQKKIHK